MNEREEIKMRNVLEIEESKKLEQARIKADQAKAKLDDEIKKANAKKRSAENHHKYMMGGIVVKYFPECYQFEEDELNRIIRAGLATRECKQVIEEIKRECAGNGNNQKSTEASTQEGVANA